MTDYFATNYTNGITDTALYFSCLFVCFRGQKFCLAKKWGYLFNTVTVPGRLLLPVHRNAPANILPEIEIIQVDVGHMVVAFDVQETPGELWFPHIEQTIADPRIGGGRVHPVKIYQYGSHVHIPCSIVSLFGAPCKGVGNIGIPVLLF